MWIDQYKKAIEQAAYAAGTFYVGALPETIDGSSDVPTLVVSCPFKSECNNMELTFRKSLRESLGDEQPFLVNAMSPSMVTAYVPVYSEVGDNL